MSSNSVLMSSNANCISSDCKICDTNLTGLNINNQVTTSVTTPINTPIISPVNSSILNNYQNCEQCLGNSSCPYVNYVPPTTSRVLTTQDFIPPQDFIPRIYIPPVQNSNTYSTKLLIKKLSDQAKIPSKANYDDAGYDLYALEDGIIQPGQRVMIKTGISMAIPYGYYGRIAPRSGLAWKSGIDILAGVVDSGYRGPVNVIAINTTSGEQQKPFEYKAGDAVAQIIIECCADLQVSVVNELDETNRGSGGFGSTGTRNQ
jgi:dUTP pyrophosphatase